MPTLRADLVDVYVFRRAGGGPAAEFLQLRRAAAPMQGSWQPVMGHIEPGETAAACALRELAEETGLRPGTPAFLGAWALQGIHPYFIAAADAVMLTPRFAAEAAPTWQPTPDPEHAAEHDAHRWVPAANIRASFLWPGQWAACQEIIDAILPAGPTAAALRLV